ncbi:MAG: RsmB/NOP family class I SAM-dependent RNA methyltransferase [Lachnospiraceae bacterium]
MNLPDTFTLKMKTLLEKEYADYISCFEEKRFYGLRVNTSKISIEKFLEICPFDLEPIPWIDNGFYYDGEKVRPGVHPYYFAGLYYLQEPSAMTPANRLSIEPGDRVLDLCAAPGGKATELGTKLLGNGLLAANDISNSRAKGLLKNIELFGIGNVLVLSEEPETLETYFPNYFDKILVDAPCSGEGMFRKNEKMIKEWCEHGPTYFVPTQRKLLTCAAHMLKPGGMIMYSTCTFDPEENESSIDYILHEFPELELIEIPSYEGFSPSIAKYMKVPNPQHAVRIWPHKMQGEGHFMALLRKKGKKEFPLDIVEHETYISKLPEELLLFFHEITWEMDWKRLLLQGEKLYYLPTHMQALKGLRFLRTGLYLGDIKKKRFEPSQALAMCLKKEEYSQIIDLELSDQRVIRYLKGETLDMSDLLTPKDKGWFLVCVDGYPLGWCKVTNQTLKNKYLPGWRWQS